MNERVINAIQRAERKIAENEQKENAEMAAHFKLFEREYAPKKYSLDDYPEYDKATKSHYRNVPQNLTNEEFNALYETKQRLDASAAALKKPVQNITSISSMYYIIGALIFFGSIYLGTKVGELFRYGSDGTFWTLVVIACGFTIMILWIALGKVIDLLEQIKNNTYKKL